jgi:hypothetical protein
MIERIKNISVIEWIMFEAIIFISLWLWDPYIGKLMTFVFSPIFIAIFIISLIADKIDPSKISSKYYLVLLSLGVVPVIIMVGYSLLENYL